MSLRIAVWNTYIGEQVGQTLCPVCFTNPISQLKFHCGHVVSEKDGGPTTLDNLRPVCASCNLSMQTQNMHEFQKTFFRT